MRFFKFLRLYLKYRKDINAHYGYALKNGYAHNEEADWLERTLYWYISE